MDTANYNAHVARDVTELAELNRQSFQAEEDCKRADLEPILADDFVIVRSTGVQQKKEEMLKAVEKGSPQGRVVDEVSVKTYGDSAVVTSRVTTNVQENAAVVSKHFWNTKVFVKQQGQWRCVTWQVVRIP